MKTCSMAQGLRGNEECDKSTNHEPATPRETIEAVTAYSSINKSCSHTPPSRIVDAKVPSALRATLQTTSTSGDLLQHGARPTAINELQKDSEWA